VFVTVFATVIALTKDMADIAGDRQFNIQTFATQLGANRLALLGGSLPRNCCHRARTAVAAPCCTSSDAAGHGRQAGPGHTSGQRKRLRALAR
jgi:hypothetical protein